MGALTGKVSTKSITCEPDGQQGHKLECTKGLGFEHTNLEIEHFAILFPRHFGVVKSVRRSKKVMSCCESRMGV